MKAVAVEQIGGPEQLQLLEVPVPAPGRDEVLVRIEAAGVNAVDAMFREGYLDSGARPLVMGSDFSGVIERLGEDANDLSVGEEVYGYKLLGNGTYAEFAVVPSGGRRSRRARACRRRRAQRAVRPFARCGGIRRLPPR